MPRRTFFRSTGDKKSTRKQHKYDQKIQAQQQQLQHRKEQQLRHQQVQHGQVDRLQASSSTNGSHDPPQNLNGPARTAPYNANDVTYHPLQESHGNHQHLQQYHDQSYGFQQNVDQNQFPQNVNYQQFQQSVEQQQYVQVGYDQMHHQQQLVHQDNASQQQHSQEPIAQSYEQSIGQQNVTPTVESATDQMWQCSTGDFRSGSLAIQVSSCCARNRRRPQCTTNLLNFLQLLRLAVVTDWEQRQQNSDANIDQLMSFPYDPSETFLSLQGAALRFHANFDTMRSDRDAFTGEMEGPDSLEWELTEQTAWEVWEEALRAAAALAHASVGPGWRYQMQLRQQLNYEAELRSMYGTTLHQRNQVVFDDFSDGGSSLGSYSFDVSNPQSSHYSQRLRPPGADILPNAVESFRVVIPEVLPAAMVRFAASVIDCTPTLRDADSKIIWEEDQTQQQMQSIILQLINEERRWIRRLKRLGDTQRLVVTHVTS